MAVSMVGQQMVDLHLNAADRAVLEELRLGRNVPANIADSTGYSKQYIRERISRLEEHGVVENIGRGVYELVDDPLKE